MCELGSVKFDKMEINTDLAEKYFKEKKNSFSSITELDVNDLTHYMDGYNTINIVTLKNLNIRNYVNYNTKSVEYINEIHEKLLKLANLVEENANTFSQIEYMIRKIPVNDVRNYDIKLIVQNLLCTNYMTVEKCLLNGHFVDGIMMNKASPLANIGAVAQLLMDREKILIVSTKETAAVTCLFVELCRSVGLNSVDLILVSNNEEIENCYDMAANDMNGGCIGVITERSDVDSAVDVFLLTTTKYPWKLSRILVQESIYDRFNKAMEWKAGYNPDSNDQLSALKRLCDKLFICNNKTFLVNYAGVSESADRVIVEAYRTNKELIALVTKYEASYTSLWSSDVSEANEVAYQVPSSIVWVNSYGIFGGPTKSSQAIYKSIYNRDGKLPLTILKKDLMTQQVKWAKKTFDERRRFLYAAIDKYLENHNGDDFYNNAKELKAALRDVESDNFVSVEDSRMCIGLSIPRDIVCVVNNAFLKAAYLAKLLTSGAAVVLPNIPAICLNNYTDHLDPEIPVSSAAVDENFKNAFSFSPYSNRTKVIWTNYGTIFAN